ncbi:uncharacterized protein LOC131164914 [Malania oleifera]|uniref:uncharacterized protein LOC131164914 n=1 Tax=Malania oleifera TaxID=397392 RepID=UPI0025AE1E63|nr:uncharacterized protein LOC131164914 [Malania oleifera]
MEKRKKDHKLAPTAAAQESEMNDSWTKEDQNQSGVGVAGMITRMGCSSHDKANSLNPQLPPITRGAYTPHPPIEQSLSIPRPIPTPSPSTVALSQWQQLPHQQLNASSHQAQNGQPSPYIAHSTLPFWLPSQPDCHVFGANLPVSHQAYAPLGAIDPSWQASAMIAGGQTSSINQLQIPSLCYPYPGFPGPWDSSFWWAQHQQPVPPCTYAFPGASGYFSSLRPPVLGTSVSGQSFQRGIIRVPAKFSQKHQQLWEAQSAENIQLWSAINYLHSELAEYKSRLLKVEAEVLALKPTIEEAAAHGTETAPPGKTSKRRRQRRPAASVHALHSPSESHPQVCGRKSTLSKIQTSLNFEKKSLNNVENKGNIGNLTSTIQKEKDEKMARTMTTSSVNVAINGNDMVPTAFPNQRQDNPVVEMSTTDFNLDSKTKHNNGKAEDSKAASQQIKAVWPDGALTTYIGDSYGRSIVWPSNISSEDCTTNTVHMRPQPLYNNDGVVGQGGKVVHSWNFGNKEYASEDLEDAVVGSAKEEDEEEEEEEEEIGDDASSAAEEIEGSKDEAVSMIDASEGTSTRGLPHSNSW